MSQVHGEENLKNGHPEGEFSELLPTIPPQQRAFIALKVVRLD